MSNLLVDDTDGVRLITFNRPEKLNAFDSALYNAAGAALEDARDDDDVKCVVLTGAGRAFSAGQDLAEMASIQPGDDAAPPRSPTASRAFSTRPPCSRSRCSRRSTASASGSASRCSCIATSR